MRIDIDNPRFENTGLQVDTGGLFGSAALFKDGQELEPDENGAYFVEDTNGEKATIRFQNVALDPVPKLLIDSYEHDVVEPLQWYEWGWVGLPFVLVTIGGCLGGALGGMAFGLNATIFRSTDNAALKWGASAAVTVAAFGIFFVLAVALELALA
jgi:hypothetical protein